MGEDVAGTASLSELRGGATARYVWRFMRLLLLAGVKDDSILAKTAGVGGPRILNKFTANRLLHIWEKTPHVSYL